MEWQFQANALLLCAAFVLIGDAEVLWAMHYFGPLGEVSALIATITCFLTPAFVVLCSKDLAKFGLGWKRCLALGLSVISLAEIVIVFHDVLSATPLLKRG